MKEEIIGTVEQMNYKKLNWNDELVKEVYSFLKTLKKEPIVVKKEISYNPLSKQFSINIPKSIIAKSKMKKNTELLMVFNPDKKIREEIMESKFVIYKK